MQNIRQEVIGNELVIRIDLTQDLGPSTSGKTHIVAKSGYASVVHPTIAGLGYTLSAWRKPTT